MQTHVLALLTLMALLVILKASASWWALLLMMAFLVIAAELVNTAIELLADAVHPDRHPKIALAKDCAAGAVLVTSIAALVVFGFFLWDRFHP